MKILVACEYSGKVRDAFIAKGHDAMSCDLLPTDSLGPHYQGNVLDILHTPPSGGVWDMMVAHPPCTFLCNSGVRWLYNKDKTRNTQRYSDMKAASAFFKCLMQTDIEKICVENPVPHKYACLPHWSQTIQPWQFGHGETKRTCLWLKGLPLLQPTNIVSGREPKVHFASPGPDRWKLRSTTFQGIADAMAEQWG